MLKAESLKLKAKYMQYFYILKALSFSLFALSVL
jgi:hypothetical protein